MKATISLGDAVAEYEAETWTGDSLLVSLCKLTLTGEIIPYHPGSEEQAVGEFLRAELDADVLYDEDDSPDYDPEVVY